MNIFFYKIKLKYNNCTGKLGHNWCAFTKVSKKIRLSTRNQEIIDESPKVSVVLPLFGGEQKGH